MPRYEAAEAPVIADESDAKACRMEVTTVPAAAASGGAPLAATHDQVFGANFPAR